MKTIYKFSLELGKTKLKLPFGAQVLHVSSQEFNPSPALLWVLLDPKANDVVRTFFVFGTGQLIVDAEKLNYVGTTHQGGFVWHVFEQIL